LFDYIHYQFVHEIMLFDIEFFSMEYIFPPIIIYYEIVLQLKLYYLYQYELFDQEVQLQIVNVYHKMEDLLNLLTSIRENKRIKRFYMI
jgi:hypothetical protein